MMVYLKYLHIIVRNQFYCLHNRVGPNLYFNSQCARKIPQMLYSPLKLLNGNSKTYNTYRPISNKTHPSQTEEQSIWKGEEVKTELNSLNLMEHTFKAFSIKQEQVLKIKLEEEATHLSQTKNVDWNEIIRQVLEMTGVINKENVNAIILSMCSDIQSLPLGKLFFSYLKSTQKQINRATYGNYLKLFYNCSSNCSKEDLNEIDTVYRELLQLYPLLDSSTAEKAVCALSITKNWREYERLFKDIKMLYLPSVNVYYVIIKTAFKNGEFELGWSLVEEMQLNRQNPPHEIFVYWLGLAKEEKRHEALMKVLNFFNKFNLKPSLDLTNCIKQVFEELYDGGKGTFTGILKSGKCKNCHGKLEPASVFQEDYNKLKAAFLNPVLIGKDIFLKTKPEEFSEFLKFVEKTSPYDVVLDGLNIALKVNRRKRSPSLFAFQLKSVVKHFTDQNKKVLVLGREHMKKWPSEDMKYVYSKAKVFLAEDISHDDPFLLFAALYSGLSTCFVSQDMMRGHKFLLADQKLQATFMKWKAQHQYFIRFIDNSGVVHLKEPVPFMQNIQCNSRGNWHIPYDVKENLTDDIGVDNYHRHWLCLTTHLQPPQRAPGRYDRQIKSGARNVPKVPTWKMFRFAK